MLLKFKINLNTGFLRFFINIFAIFMMFFTLACSMPKFAKPSKTKDNIPVKDRDDPLLLGGDVVRTLPDATFGLNLSGC